MGVCQTYPIWDMQKNFYEFTQEDKKITLKKDGEVYFETTLLKLKDVLGCPIRPFIIEDKFFMFDYDKGFEVHNLDGKKKEFFNVRAIWGVQFAGNRIFLQKIKRLVVFDVGENAIIEDSPASESLNIEPVDNYLLFYLYKRNKTFLYSNETKAFQELPGFFKYFGIITKLIKQENKLIVFFSRAKELPYKSGVYIYDLSKQNGEFYCELLSFSCNAHHYLDLLNFSFNDIEDEELILNYGDDYLKYLYFILKKFGFFAFLYYTEESKLQECANTVIGKQVKENFTKFAKRMSKYPTSNKEFSFLIDDMQATEEILLGLF